MIKYPPELKIVFDKVGPLDLDGLKKPIYPALICAIIGQKIRYTLAREIRSKLYQLVGTNFKLIDIDTIPNPILEGIGLSSVQVNCIRNVNTYLKDRYDGIIPVGKEVECIRDLSNVRGIGEWTINTTLLTWNPSLDIFPVNDIFLQERIKRVYGLKRRPNISQMKAITGQWSPHRGIITWHLWRWIT